LFVVGLIMAPSYVGVGASGRPGAVQSADLTHKASTQATDDPMAAIVRELKKEGGFTPPGFGTFRVAKTKARQGMNPRTGDKVKVKAGKTVRFKASPVLKKAV
jgi:DNA-binding protein HU-beta